MWLTALLGLLPQALNTVQGITSAIANERLALISAKTDQERIAAQERINALDAQRDVLIAESSKSNVNIYMRALAALGPIAYVLKIFLWDKVIGSFVGCVGETGIECNLYTTDPLKDPNLIWIVAAVIGFFFLTSRK